MTVYSGGARIHDGSQQRAALGLVTQATAMHLSLLASARLERLALEGLAPAGPIAASTPEPGVGIATIELLARRQRAGEACACRDLLPVSHFFHFAPATGKMDIVPLADSATSAAALDAQVLSAIARRESESVRTISSSSSRLISDARLGTSGVVALVQRDDRGIAVAVYGMVVNTHAVLAALFDRSPHRSAIDSAGLTQLDSLSLEVRRVSGEPLFGTLGSGRARAVVMLGGPMRGLELTIAISPTRVASPLLAPNAQMRLWNLGALLVATVMVLALAVTASRRELILARARSDFIAGVSHDLRMPLAQILIASETLTLRRERDESERVTLASSIVRETRRLMALVDNVLLFSRSGAVALEPMLRAVPVTELLSETVDAVQLAVEDAGQTIGISADPAALAMADRRLVRQALVNLVDNALKYGRPGQRITLAAERRGDMVQLSVEDEGPGIPVADRDRIFEPYARLEHDRVSERTGTGLGLAVVRQIAQACKGRVWLDAARERGTRVVLELQAAPAMEPFVATPEVA